ncbi:hypothetical protein [Actinoplanes sp. M2I2]|uniref:hypothetical protein n=1 Tax=Actinoplanes sp. M2I2 TaxID=1734444 RepID=UPI002020E083|nr:hypothetical protein [Actinoplanes sp. M2I2]
MTRNRREPALDPRPLTRAVENLEQASDSTLIELISRGNVPVFVALFDRTVDVVRTDLADFPDDIRSGQILASSYVEVWWLSGCHRAPEAEATSWITGIVRRRVAEARREMAQPDLDAAVPGLRPSYSELEMAALLRRPVGDLRASRDRTAAAPFDAPTA